MKKMSVLMKEMGFNPNSSDSAKEAFLKYLIKLGAGIHVQTPTEKSIVAANPQKIILFPQQLAFEFEENEASKDPKKKRSHNR